MVSSKPIVASAEEIEANPRSRSAKLWVAEKLSPEKTRSEKLKDSYGGRLG